jgi:beta propeller repeat protein
LRELSTGEDRMIIADGGNARIDGDRVVYTRVGYLWYYEISTGVETQVPVDPIANYAPSISGNRIVYTADRSGNLDIFMYEIPAPPPPAPSASNEAVSPEERMTEVFCAGLQSPWAMLGPLGLPLLAVCLFRLSFRRK